MAKLLTRSDLLTLSNALVNDFPESLFAYGLIRNAVDGILYRNMWVDSWPQFTALIITPSDRPENANFSIDGYTIYSRRESDRTGLSSLLRNKTILDWNSIFDLGNIHETLKDAFDKGAEYHNCLTSSLCHLDMMIATPDTLIETTRNLPAGIKEGHLNPDDASFVTSRWEYATVMTDAKEYIHFLIKHFPTVSLRLSDDSSILIGWALVHSYGAVAMLYVEPEYRNQGLGRHLTNKISKLIIETGRPLFLYAQSDNDVARQLYLKAGFKLTNVKGIPVRCEPKSDTQLA